MIRSKANLVIFLASSLTLGLACSREEATPISRTEITQRSAEQGEFVEGDVALNAPAIFPDSSALACDHLNNLGTDRKDTHRFSLFGHIGADQNGRIEISQSPFLRLILAEKFQVPSDNEFYQMAKAKYDSGELSWTKWQLLRAARQIAPGKYQTIKFDSINEELLKKFPGLYGGVDPVSSAVFSSLVLKIKGVDLMNDYEITDALTASLPLWTSVSASDSFSENIRTDIGAALNGLYSDSLKEQVCGFVLIQRSFGQLLTLKGYHSPKVIDFDDGSEGIRPLSKADPYIEKQVQPGTFFSSLRGKPIALTSAMIQNYDPAVELLIPQLPPMVGFDLNGRGRVAEALNLLESFMYFYDGTSPGNELAQKNAKYLLGDIEKDTNALLPADAHKLALGLMVMAFKNMGAIHIKKIDSTGKIAASAKSVKGIMLADLSVGGDQQRPSDQIIRVEDVARLSRVIVYLQKSLKTLTTLSREELLVKNSAYTDETLVSLLGKYASVAESNDRHASSLIGNLESLQLPVAMLMNRFLSSSDECFQYLSWNSNTGNVTRSYAECTPEQVSSLSQAMKLMGRATRSDVLVTRSKRIH